MRFFPLLLGFYVVSAFGSVSVVVNRPARLFAEPTERSLILTEVSGKASFRAIEQSEDKEWVFVSDALRYGWIRKSFVSAYNESLAAVNESTPKTTREKVVSGDLNPKLDFSDDDLSEEGKASSARKKRSSGDSFEDGFSEDYQGDVFVVRTAGSLYEKPVRSSNRFGNVEANDQVEVLNLSNDQKWAQVRLE